MRLAGKRSPQLSINQRVYHQIVPTRFGAVCVEVSTSGIVRLRLSPKLTVACRRRRGKATGFQRRTAMKCSQRLQRYLHGKSVKFSGLPADFGGLSAFEKTVLRELVKIPAGTVRTYAALAKKIRCPGGARAVGNALAKNPLPILYPCHRIVRSDGSLGGYSGGAGWKQKLLRIEGSADCSACIRTGFPAEGNKTLLFQMIPRCYNLPV